MKFINYDKISVDKYRKTHAPFFSEAGPDGKTTLKELFCENWLIAKTVLEALKPQMRNPMVRLALTISINVLNALENKICK